MKRPQTREQMVRVAWRRMMDAVMASVAENERAVQGELGLSGSQGRLLQYDRPAVLLTHPTDPFVARMTGLSDRAMKLLALTTAGEAALPGSSDGPRVASSASLREVLSELVWSRAASAVVLGEDGAPRGQLTVAAILARGHP